MLIGLTLLPLVVLTLDPSKQPGWCMLVVRS